MDSAIISEKNIAKNKKITSHILSGLFRYGMLLIIGYIVLYPLLLMLSSAFKSEDALFDAAFVWFPKTLSMEWVKQAYEIMDFPKALGRTLSLQIVSSFIEVFTCSLIAYGFARFNFKGKKIASFILVLTLMIPISMYGMSLSINFRNVDFLGVFGLLNKLTGIDLRFNIFNTNWTMWLPSMLGVGIRSGMIIYIYIQFFSGLPAELEEAAYVDGAGPLKTYFKIALPSSSVVIMTVTVLSFIWHWNESYLSSVCFLENNQPLSVIMANFGAKLMQIGMMLENNPRAEPIVFGACLLFIVIPLVLYLILQRKFVKSIDRVGITG